MKINSILITGGTGSFGKALVKNLILNFPNLKRLVVFSRDELKQHNMQESLQKYNCKALRFFIGDVRDYKRLRRALNNIDLVVHAAALKQVVAAEYNPIEFIHTNIYGAENLIEASIDSNVKRVVALSTDKAVSPVNLYGATKLCSDKLFISANNYSASKPIFSIVRYGNVMGSRGSVVPLFLNLKDKNIFPITHKDMTRFNISLEQGVDLTLWALKNSIGGEIFVPKIPSYKVVDLAKSISSNAKIKYIGIRPGEKLHEELISQMDSFNTYELKDKFIIFPKSSNKYFKHYSKKFKIKKLKENTSYTSLNNEKFLNIKELKILISKYKKN